MTLNRIIKKILNAETFEAKAKMCADITENDTPDCRIHEDRITLVFDNNSCKNQVYTISIESKGDFAISFYKLYENYTAFVDVEEREARVYGIGSKPKLTVQY